MKTRPLTRLALLATLLIFACNAPFLRGGGGGGGGLTTLAEPQSLLAPATYADAARQMAEAVAELNRVQEETIEHLRSSPAPETVDADLRRTGAAALIVAQLAEQLAASTAAQAGGSENAAMAAMPYVTAAQVGYLTVIESQNMREDYKAGRVSGEQVTDMIGEMGGMLWSGDHFDTAVNPAPFAEARVNPTSAPPAIPLPPQTTQAITMQVDDRSGKATTLAAWSASAGSTRTIRITVPTPRSLAVGNALDPSALTQMRTPEGQLNADVVRVAAAAKLITLGGARSLPASPAFAALVAAAVQAGGFSIEITLPTATAFQSQFGRALPYFPDGAAGVTATADTGGPLVSSVTVLDGQPQVAPPIEVTSDTPLVTLQITNAVPAGSPAADTRDLTFTVSWATTLAIPSFTLACYAGSGDSSSTPITTASGETALTLTFIRLRDTAVCQAKRAGLVTTLGESQVVAVEPAGEDAPTQAAVDTQATQEAGGPTVLPPTAPPSTAQTLNGTFTLTQSDSAAADECNISAAPLTGGTIQIVVDFAEGTASGTLSGGGSAVRTGFECGGFVADLTWDQSYTATFSGTVDAAGALVTAGTLSGTGNAVWSNCRDPLNQPFDCPDFVSGPYSFPITVDGTVDQAAGTGSGTILVSDINLETTGTWTASR